MSMQTQTQTGTNLDASTMTETILTEDVVFNSTAAAKNSPVDAVSKWNSEKNGGADSTPLTPFNQQTTFISLNCNQRNG
jgi:hypothetical protein